MRIPGRVAALVASAVFAISACSGSATTAPSASAAAASAAPSPSAAAAPTTIRLGISPFQDTLLPLIAETKGWFKDAGLDVQLTTLGWDAIVPAVASGQVDVAINNTTGVVSVANRAPDMIYWYGWNPFTQGSALMGRPSAGLKTLADFEASGMSHQDARTAAFKQLKGRTLITTLATDMGNSLVAGLEFAGLTQSDVKIIDLNPDQGLAAFLSGTGDAYLGGIPQRTRLTKEGYLVVASGPDLAPPPINGFVTTKTFVQAHPDAMLSLLNVIFRTVRYCNANTDDCGKIITDSLNSTTGSTMTPADYKAFWQTFELYDGNAAEVQRDILSPDGVAYWKKTWDQDNKSLFTQQKAIPAAVDYSYFWGEQVQKDYIAKYGLNESGQ
jgi:NitT/TauT family transport system substrate-binding protein